MTTLQLIVLFCPPNEGGRRAQVMWMGKKAPTSKG